MRPFVLTLGTVVTATTADAPDRREPPTADALVGVQVVPTAERADDSATHGGSASARLTAACGAPCFYGHRHQDLAPTCPEVSSQMSFGRGEGGGVGPM